MKISMLSLSYQAQSVHTPVWGFAAMVISNQPKLAIIVMLWCLIVGVVLKQSNAGF